MSAARIRWRHVLPTFVTVVVIGINIAIGGQAVASVAAGAGSAGAGPRPAPVPGTASAVDALLPAGSTARAVPAALPGVPVEEEPGDEAPAEEESSEEAPFENCEITVDFWTIGTLGLTAILECVLTQLVSWIAGSFIGAAAWLVEEALYYASEDISFDPGEDFFMQRYSIGFGIAMLVLCILLMRMFYRAARNPEEVGGLGNALMHQLPLGIGLCLFGPALGGMLQELANALTQGIIAQNGQGAFEAGSLIESDPGVGGDISGIAGAIAVLIITFPVMICLIIGAIFTLVTFAVQSLAMYLTGSVMAIAFVMMIDPALRPRAIKMPLSWIGIVFSKPLFFFMLGTIISLLSSGGLQGDSPIGWLSNSVLIIVALFMVALGPFLLLKYAPLMPGVETGANTGVKALATGAQIAATAAIIGATAGAGGAAVAGGAAAKTSAAKAGGAASSTLASSSAVPTSAVPPTSATPPSSATPPTSATPSSSTTPSSSAPSAPQVPGSGQPHVPPNKPLPPTPAGARSNGPRHVPPNKPLPPTPGAPAGVGGSAPTVGSGDRFASYLKQASSGNGVR